MAKLKAPAELGADIAVGSAQDLEFLWATEVRIIFCSERGIKRSIERIIGVSVDRFGKKSLDFLFKRVNNIWTDKATSNICTAQARQPLVSTLRYTMAQSILDIANRTSKLAKLFAKY